jgi:uncharacterized protein
MEDCLVGKSVKGIEYPLLYQFGEPIHFATRISRLDLEQLIERSLDKAIQQISPVWDVRDYVAVNPFFGYREHNFADAIKKISNLSRSNLMPSINYLRKQYDTKKILDKDLQQALQEYQQQRVTAPTIDLNTLIHFLSQPNGYGETRHIECISDIVDRLSGEHTTSVITNNISKWMAAYFDEGQSAWSLPTKNERLFIAWKKMSIYDHSFDRYVPQFSRGLSQLPEDPRQVILLLADKILSHPRLRSLDLGNYISRLLMTIPGWSSYIRKFEFEAERDSDHSIVSKIGGLVDLIAIRMIYDVSLLGSQQFQEDLVLGKYDPEESNPYHHYLSIWLLASEVATRRLLASQIKLNQTQKSENLRPLAQMAFCIDVRSEIIRRYVESQLDDIQTIGFAGFFGLPIRVKPAGAFDGDIQCPVLISPKWTIQEQSGSRTPASGGYLPRRVDRLWGKKESQYSTNSNFSTAETFGFSYGLKILTSSLGRYSFLNKYFSPSTKKPDEPSQLDYSSIDELSQVAIAKSILKNMGIENNMAKYIILFGHGSESANNPYKSALDCGACAGHRGHYNSRLLAHILNDHRIRQHLVKEKIVIPQDTIFFSGWHNTTTDALLIDGWESLEQSDPISHARMSQALTAAQDQARRERAQRLNNLPEQSQDEINKEITARAQDWSEVRPEWGLARNHSFIVAPRRVTRSLNLDGRSFLHDYEPSTDPDLARLELIMTAPMIVTNWINMQYYASTVDPQRFGVGNKTLTNVVGVIGCVRGNGGDLLFGLSEQSVHLKGEYFHEPIRLQVFIQAKQESIDMIISKHQLVRELVCNDWLKIISMDESGQRFFVRHPNEWSEIEPSLLN